MTEIPEAEATGEVARCYADIREKLHVPLVNLIWRHLAAIGELESCWQRVAADLPRIASHGAALNGAARAVVSALPAAPQLPRFESVSRIFVSYERGNSLNLAIVRMLLGYPALSLAGSLPDAPIELPAIPRVGDLSPGLREAIERLSRAGPANHTDIRPTLWVHLAVVPEWLQAATGAVSGCLSSDPFRTAHRTLTGAPSERQGGTPLSEAAISALSRFNLRITEMLLIGLHLEAAPIVHPGTR